MDIIDDRIDGGKAFAWGKTAADYARFRDIYPDVFYQKLAGIQYCFLTEYTNAQTFLYQSTHNF